MSATFNIELFANYFSKSSIRDIEAVQVYVGIEEKLKREAEEKKNKLAVGWGPCKQEAWDNTAKKGDQAMASSDDTAEDAWVENEDISKKNVMPIEKKSDPAVVIEINARLFKVDEEYIDGIVKNLLSDTDIPKTAQDKDLLYDARNICEGNKP